MLKNILNFGEVRVIDKKSQKTIQGGDSNLTAYLLCLRMGGINCDAHIL